MMLKTIVAMQKCIHCIYVDKRVQLLEHRTELYNYGKKKNMEQEQQCYIMY